MDEVKGGETAPALGVSLSMQYAGGRTVVMQTHLPQDASQDEINALLDRMNEAADRQEAYYAQEQARRQLEVEENAMANIQRRLAEVDENIRTKAMADGGRRNPKLSAQDEMQRKQAHDNVTEGQKRIATCRKHLEELIAKAGGRDGSSSAANH